MPLAIASAFDAGAIEVLDLTRADDVRLAIRADSHADFRQWFYFRLHGAAGLPCRLRFTNAAACTYAEGWKDYRAVASYDRHDWFRVPTRYDGQELVIEHTPHFDTVYYAYFEPYPWERHLDLVARLQGQPGVTVRELGVSVEGRPIDVVTVGEPGPGRSPVWVIARQHPGESMAEWFTEGLLTRLTDPSDALARHLRQRAVFHVVPDMNPDGSVRGNLRSNAAGANLNREWLAPDRARSPEVLHVRDAMHATGVAAFLDVHGDESLPYVFVDGGERLPSFTPAHGERERRFAEAYAAANPDFQSLHGYPRDKDTKANLALASKYVGETFGALSLTLEMPFKDNANHPDPRAGWNGARSRRLGADALAALRAVLPGA